MGLPQNGTMDYEPHHQTWKPFEHVSEHFNTGLLLDGVQRENERNPKGPFEGGMFPVLRHNITVLNWGTQPQITARNQTPMLYVAHVPEYVTMLHPLTMVFLPTICPWLVCRVAEFLLHGVNGLRRTGWSIPATLPIPFPRAGRGTMAPRFRGNLTGQRFTSAFSTFSVGTSLMSSSGRKSNQPLKASGFKTRWCPPPENCLVGTVNNLVSSLGWWKTCYGHEDSPSLRVLSYFLFHLHKGLCILEILASMLDSCPKYVLPPAPSPPPKKESQTKAENKRVSDGVSSKSTTSNAHFSSLVTHPSVFLGLPTRNQIPSWVDPPTQLRVCFTLDICSNINQKRPPVTPRVHGTRGPRITTPRWPRRRSRAAFTPKAKVSHRIDFAGVSPWVCFNRCVFPDKAKTADASSSRYKFPGCSFGVKPVNFKGTNRGLILVNVVPELLLRPVASLTLEMSEGAFSFI